MHHIVRIAAAAAPCDARRRRFERRRAGQDSGPVLKGKAAIGGWQQDKPGPAAAPDARRPAADRQGGEEFQREGADARGRHAEGSARLHGRDGGVRTRDPARDPDGAERRPVRRREGKQYRARPARAVGQRQAGEQRGLRQRPLAALRHRVLSARTEPRMGLHRQRRRRGALSLQERRPEGERRARADRQAHPVEPSLDPRHRVHARQQAAARGRLRIERRARHVPDAAEQGRARSVEERKAARRRLGHRGAPRRGAVLRSGRQEREDRRDRPAQLLRPRDPSGHQAALVRGQ